MGAQSVSRSFWSVHRLHQAAARGSVRHLHSPLITQHGSHTATDAGRAAAMCTGGSILGRSFPARRGLHVSSTRLHDDAGMAGKAQPHASPADVQAVREMIRCAAMATHDKVPWAPHHGQTLPLCLPAVRGVPWLRFWRRSRTCVSLTIMLGAAKERRLCGVCVYGGGVFTHEGHVACSLHSAVWSACARACACACACACVCVRVRARERARVVCGKGALPYVHGAPVHALPTVCGIRQTSSKHDHSRYPCLYRPMLTHADPRRRVLAHV